MIFARFQFPTLSYFVQVFPCFFQKGCGFPLISPVFFPKGDSLCAEKLSIKTTTASVITSSSQVSKDNVMPKASKFTLAPKANAYFDALKKCFERNRLILLDLFFCRRANGKQVEGDHIGSEPCPAVSSPANECVWFPQQLCLSAVCLSSFSSKKKTRKHSKCELFPRNPFNTRSRNDFFETPLQGNFPISILGLSDLFVTTAKLLRNFEILKVCKTLFLHLPTSQKQRLVCFLFCKAVGSSKLL